MDYPIQVWYGVYFSGEDVKTPALPLWARELLDAETVAALPMELLHGLAWVYCGEHYGLAVAESVQTIREPVGELTNYPVDIADIWVAKLSRALTALDAGAPTITWYAGTVK